MAKIPALQKLTHMCGWVGVQIPLKEKLLLERNLNQHGPRS